MRKVEDLTGRKFAIITVISLSSERDTQGNIL